MSNASGFDRKRLEQESQSASDGAFAFLCRTQVAMSGDDCNETSSVSDAASAPRWMQEVFTEQISTAATSLLRLIDDILDLTRIEAGKLDMVQKDLNIREVRIFCSHRLGSFVLHTSVSVVSMLSCL